MEPTAQIKLPEHEEKKLFDACSEDHNAARDAHDERINRFTRYYDLFRTRADADDKTFQVPLIQWNSFQKVAKVMDRLLGPGGGVKAEAVGPSDHGTAEKVGAFMSWRLFSDMKIANDLTVFEFYTILMGRAFAFTPWRVEKDAQGQVWRRGPAFEPLWPGNFILPTCSGAKSLHDFPFVERRFFATPNELLRGEDSGQYFGIRDKFKEIVETSSSSVATDDGHDAFADAVAHAEGTNTDMGGDISSAGRLEVLEFYRPWRMLKGRREAGLLEFDNRAMDETEIVVRILPRLNKIISVQHLAALYPKMKQRRPFVESALVRDGSYWPPGIGELLEKIEREWTITHQLGMTAGEMSVGPLVFYNRASGFKPSEHKYGPFTAIGLTDINGVREFAPKGDLTYPQYAAQNYQTFAERTTGNTDHGSGRTSSLPNQPKTATGQIALLERGDVRASLDERSVMEDGAKVVAKLWALEQEFGEKETFFRVTEKQSKGLFETRRGGATMTLRELKGRYDFSLKLSPSAFERAAKREDVIQAYTLALGDPAILQNPRALWIIRKDVLEELGMHAAAAAIPEPPDPGLPKSQSEEWNLMLQGETVQPNPMDNDLAHIDELVDFLADQQESHDPDEHAIALGTAHIEAHQRQHAKKQLMQQLTQQLTQQLGANLQQGQGLVADGGPVGLDAVAGAIEGLSVPPTAQPQQQGTQNGV